MKRFLLYIFILFIFLGFFIPKADLHAQAVAQCWTSNGSAIPLALIGSSNLCVSPNVWGTTPPTTNTQILGGAAPQQVASTKPPASESTGSCGIWSIGGCIAMILSKIAFLFMKIASLIVGLAGLLLNYVINETVVNMSDKINSITGINVAWKIIRDLMNIAFIFILVYEGIKLIIGQGSTANIQKFIFGVVLASLLINFSLFFTKIIIDSSNIATIGIYNVIVGDTGKTATYNAQGGISNRIMQALGIQEFWSTKALDLGVETDNNYNYLMANLLATALFLITAFVFFAVSIMFFVRFIILLYLLALSPVAYMGLALPGINSSSSEWWKTLMGQIIFGPLFMLMMLITLTLIGDSFVAPTSVAALQNASALGGTVDIFFKFTLIIGLTIAALVTAKKYSTQGSTYVKKFAEGTTKFAGGALFGTAGALGRQTIGATASNWANDEALKERAAKGSKLAQIQLASYRYGAKSSFDARRSAVAETIGSTAGVNLGKGTEGIPFLGNNKAGEGGYAKTKKDREEEEKKYIESLKPDDATSDAYKEKAKTDANRILNSREKLKKYEDMDENARQTYFEQNPNERAIYEQAKTDAARMKELEELDEEKRKKHYAEHPEEEEEFKKKREELANAAQVAKTSEEEAKTALDNKISESKATMEKLTADLKTAERNAQFGTGTAGEAAALKAAQEALKAETEKQKNLENEIEQEKKALNAKVTARQKADEAVTNNAKAEKDKRMTILSEEHQALVFDSQEKGQTLYQKRGEAYATSLETPFYNPTRLWRGSQENKAGAAAVRKAVKEKKSTQKLEDILKDYAKENNKTEDKKEEAPKPEAETPPAQP